MIDKYLRCETLTGEWWYKDMETGEDLPMYATPIERKSWQDLNNECSELNRICKQLKSQLQQKENIIKEVREYANTDKNCVPKHIKDYINNLLDKEVN
jgi:predicted solute-binding protein